MLAGAFWIFPIVRNLFLIISGVSFGSAFATWFKKKRQQDPYSLDTLRELVLEGEYDESNIPELDPDADVYCMYCHHTYGARFKVCPRCGR